MTGSDRASWMLMTVNVAFSVQLASCVSCARPVQISSNVSSIHVLLDSCWTYAEKEEKSPFLFSNTVS